MKSCSRFLASLSIAVLVGAFTPASARAAAFEFQFGDIFNGTVGPASTNRPWFDAVFSDQGPGTVRLTISVLTLTNSENVDELYFNLNTTLHATNLNFNVVSSSGGFDLPALETGTDAFKADGDGKYDIHLIFNNSGITSNLFTGGDSLTYDISGISGLTASDFVYLSAPAGGSGPFYGAAHLQRLGDHGDKSAWMDPLNNQVNLVPEPDAKTLWILAVSLWICFRVTKRSRPSLPQLKPSRIRPSASRKK